MNAKYILSLIALTAVTAVGIYWWNFSMPQHANNAAWFILGWYTLFTAGLHAFLTKKSSQDKTFITKFMGVTGVKLFINLIIIVIYGFNNKAQSVTFALFFLVIYFIYTIFECRQLILAYKPKKEANV